MTDIAYQVVKPRESSLVTHRFQGLGDTANLETGRPGPIPGRRSTPLDVFGGQFQMRPELFFHIVITRVSSERSPQATYPFTQRSHGSLRVDSSGLVQPCSRRTARMMETVRSHSTFCLVSSRRPAEVIA